jgi:hypothetical protein
MCVYNIDDGLSWEHLNICIVNLEAVCSSKGPTHEVAGQGFRHSKQPVELSFPRFRAPTIARRGRRTLIGEGLQTFGDELHRKGSGSCLNVNYTCTRKS